MSTNELKMNACVEFFITKLAETYGLDNYPELKKLWEDAGNTTIQKEHEKMDFSENLMKMSRNELVAHCKARNLKVSGTKAELIERLTGSTSIKPTPTKEASKIVKKTQSPSGIPKVIQSYIQTIKIARNSFGNFQHEETGLVFDRNSKQVLGKQNPNGQIDPLTLETIELCNKFKFKYVLPDNLNAFKKSNTVVIEELEDDETENDEIKTEHEDEEFLEEDEQEEELEEEPMEEDYE